MSDTPQHEWSGSQPGQPIRTPARLVKPLIDTATAQGVAVDEILRALEISERSFLDAQGDILLADYYRIQNQISAALEDETCQLSTRQLLPGTTDFILSQTIGITRLHDAMKVIAKGYNLLHGGDYNAVRRRGDTITFVIDDHDFPYALNNHPEHIQFAMECVQIFLHCMLSVVAPTIAEAALRKVAVPRPQRDSEAGHLACWSAPIEFGARTYAIDYDARLCDSTIDPPDKGALTASHVHAQIIAYAEGDGSAGTAGRTADFVRAALARGVIDQTRIAALLGVSAATLRRRLESEGNSFRDLRRDVLNDAAKALLRKVSIAEAAEELGFSDFRSFNRAFKAWNGETPKAFAKRTSE